MILCLHIFSYNLDKLSTSMFNPSVDLSSLL
ncbi:unnamed protein product [Spirodela intermedia]|uniref:Uncharacterized protein n=1 Tax=Spirodela intermedia TaxID=51605 RepID=A0A7I8J8L7_SPIIN|nr:unnamed protein product [Spirodela intermedia]CAA6666424.1 unnamed protein product [Spirodela intermedia]